LVSHGCFSKCSCHFELIGFRGELIITPVRHAMQKTAGLAFGSRGGL